ncbi:MAG TPA: Co2+/Mg2+ efflux protein ApaG, partial [Alphaproteobacteria bacterium]|nr:Co2+/Mg2+ efflux protein ApaG [Alphaproteobacteria bacterium]
NALTHDIKVSVRPTYLDAQSDPDEHRFVWAYTVRIENCGGEVVQLVARRWRITDALGRTQEVAGAGVVGEQPVLQPGQIFEYTSGAPLPTPSGFMVGRYEMRGPNGEKFEVEIPAFPLDLPGEKPRMH